MDFAKLFREADEKVKKEEEMMPEVVYFRKAIARGNDDIVLECLARGINVNTRDIDGRTPLMWAAGSSVGSVRSLLRLGADPTYKDSDGWGALEYADRCGDEQTEKVIKNAIENWNKGE